MRMLVSLLELATIAPSRDVLFVNVLPLQLS
jgi:hypothetical protein